MDFLKRQEEKKQSKSSEPLDHHTETMQPLSGHPAHIQPRNVLHLQRTIGNKRVQGLLATSPDGVIHRQSNELEDVKVLGVHHELDKTMIRIEKGIDPDSIVRVVVNNEDMDKIRWDVDRQIITILHLKEHPFSVQVYARKGQNQNTATAPQDDVTETPDSAIGAEDSITETPDSVTEQQDDSETESNTPETSETDKEDETDAKENKRNKEDLLNTICAEIEEKGSGGYYTERNTLKKLDIPDLERVLDIVMEAKTSEEKRDVNSRIAKEVFGVGQ